MDSLFFFLSVWIAGVLSFFSPCIFPLLPVYLGVLLDQDESRTIRIFGRQIAWYSLLKTLSFILGLSLVFVLLGYGAGFIGHILYTDWFRYVIGIAIIIMGLHQMDIINIKALQMQKSFSFKNNRGNGLLAPFLLGLTFSFGWTPCIGPVLSSVLALAASGGQGAVQGGLLMLVYTFGLALPFLIVAFASSLIMAHFQKIKPYMILLKKIGGALIILMGILLMSGYLNVLSSLFT